MTLKINLRPVRLLVCFTIILILDYAAPYCFASNYSFNTIDYPGACRTYLNDINNKAQIVGGCLDSMGLSTGFIYKEDSFSTLTNGAQSLTLYGINDNGQIVGTYENRMPGDAIPNGFLYNNNSFTTIGGYNIPLSINNDGQVVGAYWDSNARAYMGKLYYGLNSPLNYPGAQRGYLYGINDSGIIVGEYWLDKGDNAIPHGFIFNGGVFSTIDYPGAVWSSAHGVNNAGQVVGSYADNLGYAHGFLYSNGEFLTIDYPDAGGTLINGVNDAGQIVGRYWGNGDHGFIATPTETTTQVPEPLTLLLLSCGVSGIIIWKKKFYMAA